MDFTFGQWVTDTYKPILNSTKNIKNGVYDLGCNGRGLIWVIDKVYFGCELMILFNILLNINKKGTYSTCFF